MKVTQVTLRSSPADGNRTITCWLDAIWSGKTLEKGMTLSLKDDDTLMIWRVEEVYATHELGEVQKKGWNNNI